MEDVKNKEQKVITFLELFSIITIFSFIFIILFPERRIFNYISDNTNIKLTEIYLRNISERYPDNIKFTLSLIDLLIKEKQTDEAVSVFERNEKFILKDIFLYKTYKIKILLSTITKENKKNYNLEEIKDFYLYITLKEESLIYIDEFIVKMIEIDEFEIIKNLLIETIKKTQVKENRKNTLLKYIEIIKMEKEFKKDVVKLREIEKYFYDDFFSANLIIKTYLEAGRPDMARNFSIKTIETKKLI